MDGKAKISDTMAASVSCPTQLSGRAAMVGRWSAEAFAPVLITDPDKLTRICQAMSQSLALVGNDRLSLRAWEQLLSFASRFYRHLLVDLESLATGGQKFWSDSWTNRIVNVGLNDVLDKYFKGSTYTAAHYVGLTDGTPTDAAADTMSSHAGWAEVTAYTESVRQTYTPGTVSSQAVNNTASKATFSINSDSTTVGGAFLTTNSTKSGTTGTLLAVGAFSSGDLTLNNGSTLTVQSNFSLADN